MFYLLKGDYRGLGFYGFEVSEDNVGHHRGFAKDRDLCELESRLLKGG